MTHDLLPPNATPLERALARTTTRFEAIPFDPVALWNPAICPIALLPWLAWALSIDRWDAEWSEVDKRAAVANAIADQRLKGTRYAVEQVLASFDDLLELVEWYETTPRGAPYTFEIRLPLTDASGVAGGERVSASFASAIVADVRKAKPARAHFALIQQLELAGLATTTLAAQAMGFTRLEGDATIVSATDWDAVLDDENGEPLTDDAGEMIEEVG